MGGSIKKIQSDLALTLTSLKIKPIIPFYIFLEVTKFLSETFFSEMYCSREI